MLPVRSTLLTGFALFGLCSCKQVPENELMHDGVLVYEYPAPQGQSIEELMHCVRTDKNLDPTVDGHFRHHMYAPEDLAEWFLHKQLLESKRQTHDPKKASMFLVNTAPVLSYLAEDCNGMNHEDRQHAWAQILHNSELFKLHPKEHAFVCQSFQCRNIVSDSMKPLVREMTYLMHEQNYKWVNITDYSMENLLVIPYVAHSKISPDPKRSPPKDPSHYITFMGSLHRMGRFRKPLREKMTGVYVGTSGMNTQKDDSFFRYADIMMSSTFCLSPQGKRTLSFFAQITRRTIFTEFHRKRLTPFLFASDYFSLGDTPSTRRLFDAILAGCIPVHIGTHYKRPFDDVIPYEEFEIRVNIDNWYPGEQAQGEIDKIHTIPDEVIRRKQEIMSHYAKYIDWRHGSFVLESIIREMMQRRTGNEAERNYRKYLR